MEEARQEAEETREDFEASEARSKETQRRIKEELAKKQAVLGKDLLEYERLQEERLRRSSRQKEKAKQ